jgi:hypothetical protein
MNKLFVLFLFLLPICANAQLREFEIKERERPKSGTTVQANTEYPDNALIFVYSSLKDLNFRSSMQGISKQSYNQALNRYEIFVSPIKQILSVMSFNFIASDIATISPSPKETFYFSVEEKFTEALLGKTQLKINTSPSDFAIEINELETNYKTPFSREINSGLTKITLKKDRYIPFDTLLNLIPSKGMELNFSMKPLWGDITVTAKPETAQIFFDDKLVGSGKAAFVGAETGLLPARYTVRVEQLNHYTFTETLNLKSGDNEKIEVELKPMLGRVKLTTGAESAQVILNGATMGVTPFDKDLIIGEYDLLLKKEGFRDEVKQFKLNENTTQEFTFEMTNYVKVLKPLKTKAFIAYLIGIAGVGTGIISLDSREVANRKVSFATQLSPISFGLGGVGFISGIVYSSKIKKYKRDWNIVALPMQSGALIALRHNF